MKPVPFDYYRPDSVEDAVRVLGERGDDAKLMAGGQSLMPMLNFRVVKPVLVIDIGTLVELDYVKKRPDGGLAIGALTRHRVLETSDVVAACFPIIPETMRHVAHLAIRNRGTIGGSLSHADPAAELPMLMRLLDATIVARSIRGERLIPAADFFLAPLTTALREDELVIRVELPALPMNMGWRFEEFARRPGDFALAAVGVLLQIDDNVIRHARVAMMGVGDTPLRRDEAEAILSNQIFSETLVSQAVDAACSTLEPGIDLHGSPAYRRHLASTLMRRALAVAWARATGAQR